MRPLWTAIVGMPAWIAIKLVRAYQILLSPIFGRQCRFEPTCSAYMIGSIQKYGTLRGIPRGVWRICRCHPWHPGGVDLP